jgi:hypothetical protein
MAFQLARRIQIMVLMVPAWPESGFGNEPPGWAMGRQLAGRRDVSWRGDGTSAGGVDWDVNGGRQQGGVGWMGCQRWAAGGGVGGERDMPGGGR